MNLTELFTDDNPAQAKKLFSTTEGNVNSIRILAGSQLSEHITQKTVLLVCVIGEVIFNNEKNIVNVLKPGDYVEIEPMVKHWIDAQEDSYLLLIK
jgi:quercetin dioxygenase-like cupin family protein